MICGFFFFFKQKTAYEMRISDWSSDVCSSDLIMTSESCANGTERCAEALAQLDGTPDLIVNLQGDAPLTPHWFLEELIAAMRERQDVAVATPVLRCDQQTYTHFKDDRAAGRVGGTTA